MQRISFPQENAVAAQDERRRDDRRTFVAVIMTLAVQTAAALVWAGSANERITQIERRASDQADLGERVAGIESDARHIRRSLDRIERKLEHLAARPRAGD
ncbi:MAG: hypothetical protein AAF527_11085 [Pseudomonadota bacterium]